MSIPSPFFSYNDVANKFDVGSVSSNPNPCIPGKDPFPSSYNTDHFAHTFNLFGSYDSQTLETLAGFSNPLMQTFCNSSSPIDSLSWNILAGSVTEDKRNHKMIERQRRKEMKVLSPTDSLSWKRLAGSVTEDKRNHKMIERQRREEMKVLFSQLRSLLPEHNLRGKRTAAEEVLETVNYVCHLQQQVKELSAQREKMKVNSDQNARVSFEKICNKTVSFGGSDQDLAVKINSVGSGVQIWTNILERDIAYSDILLALEEDGLEVVSAASSAINNRVYHTIHAKVVSYTHCQ
eukprot:PITA_18183